MTTPSSSTMWTDDMQSTYEEFANPPGDDEPPLSPGEEEMAARLYREQHSRMRNHLRRNPKPKPRPRARKADTPSLPSQENPQNSAAHDAAYESPHESDDAEQGRLTIATGNITFN